MARVVGWALRIMAWCALAAPLVRWVSCPWLVWFEGRHAQLYVSGQAESAASSILRGYGLSARYRSYSCEIDDSGTPFFGVTLVGLPEFQIRLYHRAKDFATAQGTIFLDKKGRANLPPFWRGYVDGRFELPGRDGQYHTGVLTVGDDAITIPRVLAREWQVWLHDEDEWNCVLRVEPDRRLKMSIDFVPSPDSPTSILCRTRKSTDDSEYDVLAAEFTWDPERMAFLTDYIQEPVRRIDEPLPPITFEPIWSYPDAEPEVFLDIEELDAESD
ncbi:MAG: hypothetical protein HUU22_12200 [Phycisphaerae bacterium]|nr:hypothetical protein [Phycisphaerae bacterium]NUQ46779.1 hypothetical protein [Phycisphaerae bacterium]